MLQELVHGVAAAFTIGYVSLGLTLFAGVIIWRASILYLIYRNRPREVPITSRSYSVGKWIKNFQFITSAPAQILQASVALGFSSTFAMPSLNEFHVLVAGQQDVEAVCNSDEDVLSFHEAMTDRMQHYYTMWGFKHDGTDPHDNVPIRTVKVLLRKHIPTLRPLIQKKIQDGYSTVIANGHKIDEWTAVSIFQLSKSIVEETNVQVILGDELGSNPECVKAAIRYSIDAVVAAELCRQLPSILTPLIAPMIMSWSGAMSKVAMFIQSTLEKRTQESMENPINNKVYNDCIQWTMESSNTPAQRTTSRLVAQIIGLLLASSHQMSMVLVYVLYALCDHPEFIEPLRQEIAEAMATNPEDPLKEMHLLDSFLTEVSRLHPPDALTVQRKVKKEFTTPSGAIVPPGNLIAIPILAQSRNPQVFVDPDRFDGRRFLLKKDQTQGINAVSRFTDLRQSYLFWGAPRKACPGRWYVSEALKQAMVHLLTHYDFKLKDESLSRFLYWTTAIFPRPDRVILLKRRYY
ncbi:cytochrome P450 [Amniculicola lignicola CBS 123094]|uniref:Cytochrome P450 n=1 Tax=Amniculicola lignicola CBS 123094 TaxID=1392246 RepID=A0A6A5VW05_9PLEO|nr:cytochrome P450 [Amniculicola lignicola CBS 123094]